MAEWHQQPVGASPYGIVCTVAFRGKKILETIRSKPRDRSGNRSDLLAGLGKELSATMSGMASRLFPAVVDGEIDARVPGRITGYLRFHGDPERVPLDLIGNASEDLAGCRVYFKNHHPRGKRPPEIQGVLRGKVKHCTASLRAMQINLSKRDFMRLSDEEKVRRARPVNVLWFVWDDEVCGRMELLLVSFYLRFLETPQGRDISDWAEHDELGHVLLPAWFDREAEEKDEVHPAEAAMDAEAEYMKLLAQRIIRRMEREADDGENWARICREESARLRRERGQPEVPEEEDDELVDEFVDDDPLGDKWGEEAIREDLIEAPLPFEPLHPAEWHEHPLVLRCREVLRDLEHGPQVHEGASEEHPLVELWRGVRMAAGNLSGALSGPAGQVKWPPDASAAPELLWLLKQARGHLEDALEGLRTAGEMGLGDDLWRVRVEKELEDLRASTRELIAEARAVLWRENSGGSNPGGSSDEEF